MRIHALLTALGIGVVATAMAACSSGTKSTANPTTTASASTTAAATTAAATTAEATTSATTAASTTAAGIGASPTTVSSAAGAAAKDVNTCTLLTAARASTLAKVHFTSATSSTIAAGQDQCTYDGSNVRQLVVIVYQPSSGVSWAMMNSVLKGVGDTKSLTGVGDKATVGSIELDVAAGPHLIAVQGGGGLLTGDYSDAVAVAKAVVAGLA